jgi:hypothetical protein
MSCPRFQTTVHIREKLSTDVAHHGLVAPRVLLLGDQFLVQGLQVRGALRTELFGPSPLSSKPFGDELGVCPAGLGLVLSAILQATIRSPQVIPYRALVHVQKPRGLPPTHLMLGQSLDRADLVSGKLPHDLAPPLS